MIIIGSIAMDSLPKYHTAITSKHRSALMLERIDWGERLAGGRCRWKPAT